MTKIQNEYYPDYAIPPGDTLLETLELLGMSQAELARRMGRPRKTINEIIQGKTAITPETALQLELALGTPASFWINLEQQYQETLARIEQKQRLEQETHWLDKFPIADMCKKGWIARVSNKVEQLRLLLAFFSVASIQQYNELWDANFAGISFRQTATNAINREAVAAWLRKGELDAQAIDCQRYDVYQFRAALEEIRHFTVKAVEDVWTDVEKVCAQAGIAAVIVPDLPNTGLCGASRWLNPYKAVVQLSLRYKSDDQFWFSFFHESGHILRHGKSKLYIELSKENSSDADKVNQEEEEANQFAADFLIPPTELRCFLDNHQDRTHFSKAEVLSFAEPLGIAPGIVVGRLQHDGYLPKSHMNGLKRRLQWDENGQVISQAYEKASMPW